MHHGWIGFYILQQIIFWLCVLTRWESASYKEGRNFQQLLIKCPQHASHLAGVVDAMMCEKRDPWFPKHINKNGVILLIKFSQQEVTAADWWTKVPRESRKMCFCLCQVQEGEPRAVFVVSMPSTTERYCQPNSKKI